MERADYKKKMLIVTPSFHITGGVANHHQGLRPFWNVKVCYAILGKRAHCPAAIMLIPDLIVYLYKLLFSGIDIVMINPSLRPYQLIRDGVYLLLARLCRKKVVTFIHGWGDATYERIKRKPKLFCSVYGKSSLIFVLYSVFRDKLKALPLHCEVCLTTTKVRQSLIDGADASARDGKISRLLFLARADKAKGLDVTIKAFEILKESHPEISLCVCGDGNALQDMKAYVSSHGLKDVSFEGNVSPDEVKGYYEDAQVYLLPTHGEGMATTVLEAMAMGLVVITRPVGGVNDFFEEGKMGYLLESLSPQDYASKIDYLIDHPALVAQIARYNHQYAVEHFAPRQVVNDLEQKIFAAID